MNSSPLEKRTRKVNLKIVAPSATFVSMRKVSSKLCYFSVKGATAGDLVNPKTSARFVEESEMGRELYRRTPANYQPEERLTREYASPPFNNDDTFGVPTPHDNTGETGIVLKFIKKPSKFHPSTQVVITV